MLPEVTTCKMVRIMHNSHKKDLGDPHAYSYPQLAHHINNPLLVSNHHLSPCYELLVVVTHVTQMSRLTHYRAMEDRAVQLFFIFQSIIQIGNQNAAAEAVRTVVGHYS
jgi:hypothetical protein